MTIDAAAELKALALPGNVEEGLASLLASARDCFGDDLESFVLYGSAAERRLRATSDVNVMLVLVQFQRASVDPFREPLRVARAVARVAVMFVLGTELALATEAFAVKFDGIRRRHVLLHGEDPFRRIEPSRSARIDRLRQATLNQLMRLRERYAMVSLREEQLVTVIANAAGPMRANAATLLELQGDEGVHPKEALQKIAGSMEPGRFDGMLQLVSQAREAGSLAPGAAAGAMFDMIELAARLRCLAAELK